MSKEEIKTLIQFARKKGTIEQKIKEIEREPYSSLAPLKLAIIEMENENSIFIDDSLFENRKKIENIRKMWWGY